MRLRVAQRLQQVLHRRPLAVALQRVQPDLVEQVALRMAAANLHQPGQGHAQLLHGSSPVALRMRQQAVCCRQADLLPHGAFVRLGAGGGVRGDVVKQRACCLCAPGAGQAVEVLQV